MSWKSVHVPNLNSNQGHVCIFVNDLLLSCALAALSYNSAKPSICSQPLQTGSPAPRGHRSYGQGQWLDKLVAELNCCLLTNCDYNIWESKHMTCFSLLFFTTSANSFRASLALTWLTLHTHTHTGANPFHSIWQCLISWRQPCSFT